MTQSIKHIIQSLGNSKIFIQPHDIPDPDAIASSYGFQYLLKSIGIDAEIIYASRIEKSNSQKMIELFNIEMTRIGDGYELSPECITIFMDTQQSHSNLTTFNGQHYGAIDHHRFLGEENYVFMDIRPEIGACATVVASYFKELDIEPSIEVATSLLYAIMTDTDNLIRTNDELDLEMFYWLYKKSDLEKIKFLRMNEIGSLDLEAYTRALQNIEIYGETCFVDIGECNDSLQGTISDMVFTIENVDVIVSYAKRADGVKLSIRSGDKTIKANDLVNYIIDNCGTGGGHDEMAGGFISKADLGLMQNKNFDTYVRYRAIKFIERTREEKKHK